MGFSTNKRFNLLRDNPATQRMPTTQREWSDFIQELDHNINYGKSGSFTPTFGSGFSSDPIDAVVYWNKVGPIVTMSFINSVTGTSNGVTFTITNLPEQLRPSSWQHCIMTGLVDNGVESWGCADVLDSPTITFNYEETGANWTGSGGKGFATGGPLPTIMYNTTSLRP